MDANAVALDRKYWQSAAGDLGIEVVIPYQLTLPSGHRLDANLLVRSFGAQNGMLVVREATEVLRLRHELAEAGYGFSVMEPMGHGDSYQRGDLVDLLADWGWSGPPEECPVWLVTSE